MSQDRRSFLASIAAAAFAASCRRTLGAPASLVPTPSHKLNRIGIQLYTLRRQATADLAGVLSRLATIGYKEVEFAGYYNKPVIEIRDMLRANGLTAPSAHIAIDLIERDPARVFADAHTLGHEWITVPSLPRGQHVTADDWKKVAAQFTAAAKSAKDAGFRFAFHNHNDIVKRTGDVLPIDILMTETDPTLVSFQMDIFWAVSGGANPLELLARYPGRFAMFHIKDGKGPPFTDASQTDVGAGQIDFRPILAKAPGSTHYFVESDSAADPYAFAANSYRYLNNLEF